MGQTTGKFLGCLPCVDGQPVENGDIQDGNEAITKPGVEDSSSSVNPSQRVFVITGANKGIGKGIVEALCQWPKKQIPKIVLACRNQQRGKDAMTDILMTYPAAKG